MAPLSQGLGLWGSPTVFFLRVGFVSFPDLLAFGWVGCRDWRPSSVQNRLHWCSALNWSIKDAAQFPLKPLYLREHQSDKAVNMADRLMAR